ncbi:MAG TPA: BTAD domain-containing putative transcriptional regulator [Trebonia sp.]|nr:BTAD domain-containing putative transcriptional regulator [Trebonia sp.]
MLATLLLNAGRVVSVDDLAEALWGPSPPPSARVTVQNYVMRLRKALGTAGARISTQPHGYIIHADPDEVDVSRFETNLDKARAAARNSSWRVAAVEAQAALSLWRGEPLADIDSDLLETREGPRLKEMRLQAVETRIDADLHLGRHAEVVTELRELTAKHPLRERLHGSLILALYRDERRAEALAAYQQARQILVEELGTEPGVALQKLHRQVLFAEPVLAVPEPAPPTRPAAVPPMPRQLPPGTRYFVGRALELAMMTEILDTPGTEAPGEVVIGGTAGVGKTALALHWAHQSANRFSDGQLYVDLHGFGPAGVPVSAEAAVRGFLQALGVPANKMPQDTDARAALYRSLLAEKRVLVLLDNARDEAQVRPLLPASPGSMVVVTSRNQLSGLAATDGARLLSLEVLSHDEAICLFTARVGTDRAAAEQATIADIARLCGRLPLALAVAAARAATRPAHSLASVAAELHDTDRRLEVLDTGDPMASVKAVFSWSYRQLCQESARMFRLLGLHAGPDISVRAAASLAGIGEPQARCLLDELARAHLMTEHVGGRYTFHDLLHAYAADAAATCDSESARSGAVGRVLDHYLQTAHRGAALLQSAQEPIILTPAGPGTTPEQLTDHEQALTWFDVEHPVLLAAVSLAAQSGFSTHSWQLAWAITPYLTRRGEYQERVTTQRLALAAAAQVDDRTGQAVSSRLLAQASAILGDHEQALAHYSKSLMFYRELGNRMGEAKIHQCLGLLAEHQGRYTEAIGEAQVSLTLFRAISDKAGEVEALNNLGWYYSLAGDARKAQELCKQALALNAETGHRWAEASILDSLGYTEHLLGNFGQAVACYDGALSICRELGYRLNEADILAHLGDTRHAEGNLPSARGAWTQALTIYEELHHPNVDAVRVKLDALPDGDAHLPKLPGKRPATRRERLTPDGWGPGWRGS